MAQKHRFKKEREFKQRLEETEQNEEADIRSFTFHHHDLEKRNDRNNRSIRSNRSNREDREDNRNGKGRFNQKDRDFRKDRKDRNDRSPRKGRDFDKKGRRFDDDDED